MWICAHFAKKEIAAKFDEIVSFSGCERYIDTPVKRYSSGMKVRLAFAVAAHLEPERLDLEPDEGSEHVYENWKQRWSNYIAESGLDEAEDTRKHRTIFSRVGLKISGCLKGKTTYNSVIEALDALYLTKRNVFNIYYRIYFFDIT